MAPRRMSAARRFYGYGQVLRSERPLTDRSEPKMFICFFLPKHELAQNVPMWRLYLDQVTAKCELYSY